MNLRPSGYEPDELPGCSTPREWLWWGVWRGVRGVGFGWPGGDLLSRVLGRSTIGAEGVDGRVRDGIGCWSLAMTTRPGKPRRRADGGLVRRPASAWGRVSSLERVGGLCAGPLGRACRCKRWDRIKRVRAISTGWLRALPHVHARPIDVVVFHGSHRDLVLRGASRLDAFSGYPVRT